MNYNYIKVKDENKIPGFGWDAQLMECLENLNAYDIFINWDGGMIYLDESTVEIARERLGGEALQKLEILEEARVESGVDILKVLIE